MSDVPRSGRGDFKGPGSGRPFKRGELKYLILHFLKDKPGYGYEIMMALGERFYSFYVPSPGSIYPTLQGMVEKGYVTSGEQEGKRLYTITREGRDFLDERSEFAERMREHIRDWCNSDNIDAIRRTMSEFDRLAQLLKENVRIADAEKLGGIRRIITRAREEISEEISRK